MGIVLTSGCYDLLHVGHLRHLEACRRLGTRLVVALNSDASVRRLKGPGRPVIPQADRRELLLGLYCVDDVLLFDEPTPERWIAELRPAVFAVGADWRGRSVGGRELVESYGGRVAFTDCPAATTSEIIARVRGRLCRGRACDCTGCHSWEERA